MTSKPNESAGRDDEDDAHSSAAKDDAAVDPIVTEATPNMRRASDSLASMGSALQDAAEQTKRLLSPPTMAPPRIPARSLGMADVAARLASTFPSMEERTRATRSFQKLAEEASRFYADVQQRYQRAADLIAPLSGASALMASQSAHEQLVRVMRVHEKQFEQMRYPTLPAFDADALASYRAAVAQISAPLAGFRRLAAVEILRQREVRDWTCAPGLSESMRQSYARMREVLDSLSKVPDLSALLGADGGYVGTVHGGEPIALALGPSLPAVRPIRAEPAAPPAIVDRVQPGGGLLALDEDEMKWLMLLRREEKQGLSKEHALRLFYDIMAGGSRHQPLARDSRPQDDTEARPVKSSAGPGGVLIRDTGAVFKVHFKGKTRDFQKLKGIAILKILTDRPDNFFSCLELRGAVAEGSVARSVVGENDAAAQRYGLREGYDRLAELKEEIQEAEAHNDWDRKASIETQYDKLVCKLSEAAGGRSRGKKVSPELSRARIAVTAAIKYAYSAIELVMPELEQHLRDRVKTGYHCRYMKLSEKN